MSFRRSRSTREPQRSPVTAQPLDESVEDPNSFGIFGHHNVAPLPTEVHDHSQDHEGVLGHAHEPHRLNGVDDVHPGWQTVDFHRNHNQERYEQHHQHGQQHHQHQQQRQQAQLHQQQQPYQQQPPHQQQQQSHQQHHQPHQQQQQAPQFHIPLHMQGSQEHLQQQQQFGNAETPAHHTLDHGIVSSSDMYHQQALQTPHDEVDTPLVQYAAPYDSRHSPSNSHASTVPQPPRMRPEEGGSGSAFDLVHGAKDSNHIAQHGEQIPVRIGHLFKRPLVRQWVLQDKVYREMDDREPSQFELFFDLVMVGIIHKLADGAAEQTTALNVAKFVLCFYPAWSVWSDVRSYINVSGTDDVWQRIYVLLIMILLVGYAANATGITIEKAEPGEAGAEAVASTSVDGNGETAGEAQRRALVAVAGTVGAALLKRAESEAKEVPKLVREIGNTGYWFAEGWYSAVSSAIGFYLVAKFCRLTLFFIYGVLLPKFRKALWLQGGALVIVSCTYLPIMFIEEPGIIVILIVAGVVLEIAMRYLIAASMQFAHGRAKHKGHKTYLPAYSLPHMMERTTLFTILVIGESIMNATYVATQGQFGASAKFWRACLGVVIAFLLMWISFDQDSSRTFVHALKRHWFLSITYTNLHFPMCAAFILMSSSLANLIAEDHVEEGFLWFFSLSIATAMFCMGLLGVLHKSLDRWGSSLIPKSARIGVRFLLAGLFAAMPKLHHWNSVEFLGAHAALLAMAVAFETFGKLGAVGRVYDPVRAGALLRQRMGKSEPVTADDGYEGPYGGKGSEFAMSQLPSASSSPTMERNALKMTPLHTQPSADDRPYLEKAAETGNFTPRGGHARDESRFTMMGAVHRVNKDAKVKSPGRRASWHEYDDLTGAERGEDDVGIESELGKLEAKEVSSGERWAYVAT